MTNLGLSMLLCGSLFLAAALAGADGRAQGVGREYPDFTLPRISDGEPVSLSQFRGRKVLLIQFASW